MAQIILDPGETFEHFHSCESESILLEGEARLIVGGRVEPLVPGRVVTIPADTPHTLENTGGAPARFACVHAPPPA